jgi:hypothetical protein
MLHFSLNLGLQYACQSHMFGIPRKLLTLLTTGMLAISSVGECRSRNRQLSRIDAARPKATSEKNIEVERKSPIVASKEAAILGITDVGVHLERIEVVGEITDCTREPHGVFRVHPKIF